LSTKQRIQLTKIKELEQSTRKTYFKLYNSVAQKYPETKLVHATEMGKTRKKYLIKLLKSTPNALTLDLGCNDGHYKPYIRRYVGLDIASGCLKKFRAPRLQAIAQILPFRKNIFDRIFASETIEHIWDRDLVLRECKRVLKQKGKIIVAVPYGRNLYQLSSKNPVGLRKYGVKVPRYVHGKFSKEDLKHLLERNGFFIKLLVQLKKFNVVAIGVNS